ncbi:hypothetical protein GE061_009211 [Apolygus lucorum]|uniref:Uncharacterized protein n=1 Tax=Apolygus lucorum TaxID=248454 RepID=A0A8S9Y1M8_APOLU|nr:hypothetical protein GE061_009211 [Apolygus lucorum]
MESSCFGKILVEMGITDNLFQRKSLGHLRTTPRVAGTSQQYRLANIAYQRKFGDRNFGPNAGSKDKDEKALKKGECVTRFFVDEKDGNEPTLVGSSISTSLPDLSLSSIYDRSMSFPECLCYRPPCYIACDEFNCNFTGIGRVRSRCPNHPTVTFLLDLPQCPKCLGSIREYPDRIVPIDDDEDL